jgi:hypothetical protein
MTLFGGAVAALVLVGCAAPGYNPTGLESELVRAGATPAQAQCVTRGLTDTFDENQLGSHSTPTQKELATTRTIFAKCDLKLPLQPR